MADVPNEPATVVSTDPGCAISLDDSRKIVVGILIENRGAGEGRGRRRDEGGSQCDGRDKSRGSGRRRSIMFRGEESGSRIFSLRGGGRRADIV